MLIFVNYRRQLNSFSIENCIFAEANNTKVMGELYINGQIESQFATQSLMQDLRQIIEQARNRVAYIQLIANSR